MRRTSDGELARGAGLDAARHQPLADRAHAALTGQMIAGIRPCDALYRGGATRIGALA